MPSQWAERSKVVRNLANKFDEHPTAIGLADNGSVIELFKSTDGSTWTIITTLPNGYSGMVVSGEAWMPVPIPTEEDPPL